jgi:predicted enzyme related to lactoylglutathione lyase
MNAHGLLVNVDVDDLERGKRFYCEGLGLRVGRQFDGWVELVGRDAPIYLLPKEPGTEAFPKGTRRSYGRHWTPVHLDFVVEDIAAAIRRAVAAGATVESDVSTHPYGKLALLADPFGNGFCLLEFTGRGYDEITVR